MALHANARRTGPEAGGGFRARIFGGQQLRRRGEIRDPGESPPHNLRVSLEADGWLRPPEPVGLKPDGFNRTNQANVISSGAGGGLGWKQSNQVQSRGTSHSQRRM